MFPWTSHIPWWFSRNKWHLCILSIKCQTFWGNTSLVDINRKTNLCCGGKFSKAPLCYEAPAGAFVFAKLTFLDFRTCPFGNCVHLLIFGDISKNGSWGQTTMLPGFVSKFCVEPRSPFSNISHHDPKTMWETSNIVPWPECQPEFLNDADGDGDGDGGAPTIFLSGQTPSP